MRDYTETRRDIEEGIKIRHLDNKDRARHMGLIVDDKKVVAHTTRKVSLSALKDGAEKVKKALVTAAVEIHKEFERQNHDLQKRIDHCKQAETKLAHKETTAMRDAVEIERAAARIKESKKARHLADIAELSMIDDVKFLKKEQIIQQELRKQTESKREIQKARLKAAKLKW